MNLLFVLLLVGQNVDYVSSSVLTGADRRLVVAGSRLYSACERGLDIFDISVPESIRLLGNYNTPGIAYGCAVADTIAYVADNFNGLIVLSVADPERPHYIARYPMSSIEEVCLRGTLAFCGSTDLVVLDVSDPANPTRLGSLAGLGIKRIAVRDTVCFVAAQAGLFAVSVQDPAHPRIIDTLPTSWLRDVTVQGDYVYCCGDTELLVFDARDLSRVGRYDAGYLAFGLAVKDSFAFLCRGQNMDVRIVNVANPAAPVYRGQFTCQNGPQSAAVAGRYCFAGVWSRDLLAADFSNPAAPVIRGRFKRPGEINGAWREGNLVVTADRWYGATVVDVSDIYHPVELGDIALSGYPRRVVVRDSLAYVANYNGFAVVNLADPASPELLAQTTSTYYTYKIAVKDTFAYVAEREWNPYHGNLLIWSIADPAAPRLLGQYATSGGGVEALAYQLGRYCYVVSQGWSLNEFAIVNVENPAAPYRVSGVTISGYPIDVDAAGDYCYALMTSPNQRIEVISIADTLVPVVVAQIPLTLSPRALYVRPPYLVVSYYYHGIEVYDISNPAQPRLVGAHDTPGSSQGLYVDDDFYIYIGDSHSLEILRFTPSGVAESPNPARRHPAAATVVSGAVRLTAGPCDLLDVTGRRIASSPSGAAHGLSPGVYFVREGRAEEREPSCIRKVVVAK